MEYIIRFSVNLFDLGMFWYYLNSFKKMKSTPKILFVMYIMAMAAIWSGINALNYPFLNLLTLVSVLLIKVDTTIRIPKQMQLEHGDIGVLYGNLLDNAIEACRKVEEDRRFIRIENKFTEGKLLLIVENSKTGERNESLKTTKKDNYSHGRGIHSVRKVVEKYNGTVTFTDKGEIFEVSAMLYGIEAKE